MQELLRPRQRRQDPEIYDDSEEENRLIARRPRADRVQAATTKSSLFPFCCGFVVGVPFVLLLLTCLVVFGVNGTKTGEVRATSCHE